MKIPPFQSNLGPLLKSLIRLRQSLGYGDRPLISHLTQFDRFLIQHRWKGRCLTRTVVEDWVSSASPIKPITRAKRLHTMRVLGRFIAQTHPETYIPGPAWGPRQATGFRPHIYSHAEIHDLLNEASRLTPLRSLRPKTYATLLSLLACTGLRISEALALTLSDVDLESGILLVRESKFHKSRALPLHLTTTLALREFRLSRDARGNRKDPEAPFFVNERKGPLSYPLACATFLQIARRTGIRPPPGQKGPRIHDLRHSFATGRLLTWYRDGQDVQARLPLLATYMGHVSIVSTQIYLESTAELLTEAANRFKAPRLNTATSSGGSQ